jgi:hypothetical protein
MAGSALARHTIVVAYRVPVLCTTRNPTDSAHPSSLHARFVDTHQSATRVVHFGHHLSPSTSYTEYIANL